MFVLKVKHSELFASQQYKASQKRGRGRKLFLKLPIQELRKKLSR